MKSRAELLTQMQEHPDIVLLMDEVRAMLEQENKKRVKFRNLIHENVSAEFINGEIIYHSPVKRRHWRISTRLTTRLGNHVEKNNLGEVGVEKVMIE